MIASLIDDKTYLTVIILAILTGFLGVVKLAGLKSKRISNMLTDEQSDQLVIGVFHLLISVTCLCCLI
nr:hypothetical protein [Mucilaginibacter sp. FT3.2]